MPFCPNCRAEFRAGFKSCKTCGGFALVDTLPGLAAELGPEDFDRTLPVGLTVGGSGRTVDVDGHAVDPSRVFDLASAMNLKAALAERGFSSLVSPLDAILFPDGITRFEVRVRAEEQARAESVIVGLWQEQAEAQGLGGASVEDIETCPACGSRVPLEVEECPDCGLVVGSGAERSAQEA